MKLSTSDASVDQNLGAAKKETGWAHHDLGRDMFKDQALWEDICMSESRCRKGQEVRSCRVWLEVEAHATEALPCGGLGVASHIQ
jgi:hypothetical protein